MDESPIVGKNRADNIQRDGVPDNSLKNKPKDSIEALIGLIETLRGEHGCPWDRKQTVQSMSVYLQEEMHELLEAIQLEQPEEICKELGDVLFQLVFIVQLYRESELFDFQDVVRHNIEKMIRRHPHVFGDEHLTSVQEIKKRWNQIKRQERQDTTDALPESNPSLLDSVPAKLPPLLRAYRISERAAAAGFDWDDMAGVMDKVEEEWEEFKQAIDGQNAEHVSEEFGDLLFTMTNVARFAGVHPETALTHAINKFETRYRHMEKLLSEAGKMLDSISREDVDRLWNMAKQQS